MLSVLLQRFIEDPTVRILLALVPLDLALGVIAALKLGTFRLSYVSDFLRNDVLGKVAPYFLVWAAVHVSGIDFTVLGIDAIEETAGALAIAALAGSLFKSLADLGLGGNPPDKKPLTLGDAISGGDPNAKI